MQHLYPIRLEPSFHKTIWGGRRLERDRWKRLPPGDVPIGESWETEVSTIIQNGTYAGRSLATLVDELGPLLLGEQAISTFGRRFPLLAKFADINAAVSVHVHPNHRYAAQYESGKLGKTEFWFILAAEPYSTIVHGFKSTTSSEEVKKAIKDGTLDSLLHREAVHAGDIIFVPAGTVHAIGGVVLYELQEYSDITYRMYDYGRLTASGSPRELHIEHSLEILHYDVSRKIKVMPVPLIVEPGYEDHCLVACQYFVTRKLLFKQEGNAFGSMNSKTKGSCIILSSLGAEVRIRYGTSLENAEPLSRGQTMVLPAALGNYLIEGSGTLLYSYVPTVEDEAWQVWEARNS